jgi:hypothetical protein
VLEELKLSGKYSLLLPSCRIGNKLAMGKNYSSVKIPS